MFENAAAVSEQAFFITEILCFKGLRIEGLNLLNGVFHFCSICTNVLYRTGTHVSRDVRQIFKTIPAFVDSIRHKLIPVFTCTGLNNNLLVVFFNYFYSLNLVMNHQTVKIGGKKYIAATS